MGQGAVQGTLQRKLVLGTRGQKSQQEELRGVGGEKGQCRGFFTFTFTKSESDSSCIFIAVIQLFVSVLEKGSMPKVQAINVSKYITSLYIAAEDL